MVDDGGGDVDVGGAAGGGSAEQPNVRNPANSTRRVAATSEP